MPCNNENHSHVWPTEGVLVVERCENICGFCGKVSKYAWFNRRHLKDVHCKKFTQLVVLQGWTGSPEGNARPHSGLPKKKRVRHSRTPSTDSNVSSDGSVPSYVGDFTPPNNNFANFNLNFTSMPSMPTFGNTNNATLMLDPTFNLTNLSDITTMPDMNNISSFTTMPADLTSMPEITTNTTTFTADPTMNPSMTAMFNMPMQMAPNPSFDSNFDSNFDSFSDTVSNSTLDNSTSTFDTSNINNSNFDNSNIPFPTTSTFLTHPDKQHSPRKNGMILYPTELGVDSVPAATLMNEGLNGIINNLVGNGDLSEEEVLFVLQTFTECFRLGVEVEF